MCGICGVINYSRNPENLNPDLLLRMRDTLIHRGPDDAGIYISQDKQVGFGHRRLSIIDLSSAGRQPMCNEDQSIWISCNGEIYNHEELRKRLVIRGHRYRSKTDTETILHLYEEEGIDCINSLDGVFAFSLWDEKQKLLFLVRDRLGQRPLYYSCGPECLVFASEIKAILEHPVIKREVDEEALYHFLTFMVTPSPFTLFKDIKKVPPATYIIFNKQGKLVEQKEYWNPLRHRKHEHLTEEICIERIRNILDKAVEKRLMSDVPFGAFLSGGIDSSTNVAIMGEKINQPVTTFTIYFEDELPGPQNEIQYARRIAKMFSTSYHELCIHTDEIIKCLDQIPFYYDDPVGDTISVSQYFIARFARENGIIVAQVGEGSDEMFAGYQRYINFFNSYLKTANLAKYIPSFFKRAAYTLLIPYFHLGCPSGRQEFLRRLSHEEELFWSYEVVFNEIEKRRIFSKEYREETRSLNSYEIVKRYSDEFNSLNPKMDDLTRIAYFDLKLHLPERAMMRGDKMSMANSVETRAPFMDYRLIEFAMGIPASIKAKGNIPKYLMKRVAEKWVPKENIYRSKVGFLNPLRLIERDTVRKELYPWIFDSKLRRKSYFDYKYLYNLFEQFRDWEAQDYRKFEILLMLHHWYDRWF